MSVLTLKRSALVLDLTQLCHCIIQTHHQCPSAGLCESSQDDVYRKEKPARWCLLLAATSLRWTTKSGCSLSAIDTGKTLLHVVQRPQLKSDFMLYTKVDFSYEHAYERKQRIQHSSSEQLPYPKPLSWCEGNKHEATATGGQPHCAHRATCAPVPMKAPKEEGGRDSRLFLCGWDMLPMHLWAGGDCLALHLPTAQTAHLWPFSIYMGISHARAPMLQLWWCNPAMSLVTQSRLEQDGKV